MVLLSFGPVRAAMRPVLVRSGICGEHRRRGGARRAVRPRVQELQLPKALVSLPAVSHSSTWPEHAKGRSSPVENGVLDGTDYMEREQRDKQAASSVVYLFQERVELGVRCQRGWEPQPGQVKRAPHRPGRQVPRDDNREDEHEKSPVHDARHETEERGLIREIGGAPPDPVPHAPAQKQRSYRAPAHVEGARGGALVGEEQRHDQDCGEPVDHDGQERAAIDRPPTIEHVTDHAAASLGGSCRSPRPRRTCTTWSTSSCAPAIRATPTSTA